MLAMLQQKVCIKDGARHNNSTSYLKICGEPECITTSTSEDSVAPYRDRVVHMFSGRSFVQNEIGSP
ncbi:hypothetical protein E2C01_094117 [Portunus trituberculatus]|uniref:Uncharacterized protein n=1 Tax=Portunus trituberculatus TaxID=210409 RepID=A0A5B7JZY5_PORTR|nr:hypothetical protein [Portunus trituberculatus]